MVLLPMVMTILSASRFTLLFTVIGNAAVVLTSKHAKADSVITVISMNLWMILMAFLSLIHI